MKFKNNLCVAMMFLAALTFYINPLLAGTAVLTYHNNNSRTGANTNESWLIPANVNTNTFGLLMKYEVDGYVYTQPLYFPGLEIPGHGTHNAVFIGTQNNSVYALDADDNSGTNGGLLWHANLGDGIDIVTNHEFGGRYHNNVLQDLLPRVGITGTPVIDAVSGTLYVDAFTRTATDTATNFQHKIHALNLINGAERPFSPVEVMASVPGNGVGSSNGLLQFEARQHMQRPALTLAGGILYVAYGSAADTDPYHGWIIGFDAATLRLLTNHVFNTTPNATVDQFGPHAGEGALWMGGNGLCVDENTNLYFEVANGSFTADASLGNGADYGDSFMKLSTANHRLAVADYFTPFNQAAMQEADADFGSGGAVVLPDEVGSTAHPHLIVGGDKASKIYLVDRDNMGRYNATNDDQIVQEFYADAGKFFSTPAYFNHQLYYQGVGGVMKAFSISNGLINTTPVSATKTSFSGFGTTPSVSANGRRDGIVWTIQSDGAVRSRPAILHAYNATNLAQELYNSSQLPDRDNPGNAVKMTVPTVADGKVFIGAQYALSIFGNSSFLAEPLIYPPGGDFKNSVTIALTDTEPDAMIYYTLDGTAPTTHSRRYLNPFTVTTNTEVKAMAAKPGAVSSGTAVASFVNIAAIGGGSGLLGQYWTNVSRLTFTNESFAVPASLTRTDAMVNFDGSAVGRGFANDQTDFIARWSGSVQSQYSDTYEFAVATPGAARLWLNGRLLIDDWAEHSSPATNRAAINLKAQQLYNVQLDCSTRHSGNAIQLLWRRSTGTLALIPQTQLYPRTNPPPAIAFVNPADGSSFEGTASVTVGVEISTALNQIARVDFFANSQPLGTLTNSSYAPVFALTATGLKAGPYSLTAVVTDESGLSTSAAPVNITVNPGSGLPYGLTNREGVAPFLKLPATFNDRVPTLLSDTGAFSSLTNRIPARGLIPYDLNAPMWSDGAVKSYFMAVPNTARVITPDEQLRLRPTSFWKFPEGTVFIKNFDLVVDEIHSNAPRRRLETQFLVRDSSGAVYGMTYKWRPDRSDADLITAGLSENIVITNATGIRTQTWYYASPSDCLTCHTPGAGYVLGVNTRQLNGSFTYPATGVTDNQIRTLNRLGLFSPAINEAKITNLPKLSGLSDSKAPLAERARSYLDANCAQCHRPGGVGNFDARYDTPVNEQRIINAPAAVTLGLANPRIVMPQDTAHSVLYLRLTSTNVAVKMPPLSHNQIDTRAAQVIGDWINRLPVTPGE